MIKRIWKEKLMKAGIWTAGSIMACSLMVTGISPQTVYAGSTSQNTASENTSNKNTSNKNTNNDTSKEDDDKKDEEKKSDINYNYLVNRDPSAQINNTDRQNAYILIVEYMDSMKTMYDISDTALKRMDDVFYQANVYIANSHMTVGELIAYVETVKANLQAAAGNPSLPSDTSSFLFLMNEIPSSSAKYGQSTSLKLSVVNLSKDNVSDVVIRPVVSTNINEWPFVIANASDVKMIKSISPGADTQDAYNKRQDVTWEFTVAKDAKTGTYPLKFHVQYYRNGNIEEADLTTYVNIQGKAESGTLQDVTEAGEKTSTPRIIVTGFSTDPGDVYGGDTFKLTITVQNTSSVTDVSNIQFDLKAAQTGNDTNSTYEAFLPTSGSATIYVDKIGMGESKDISIEMTARSDLAQKPYVITVDAQYEDKDHNPYQASTNVSIPVKQNARYDTGAVEVSPDSIPVGGSSNIMFSIYNMGKTTLYNVQVTFEGDSVSSENNFIGKIEPDGTGNVDAMVDGVAPTMDDGIIKAVISYEDEAGNVSTFEKEITLFVYEEVYDDAFSEFPQDDMMMDEDINAKPKTGMIVGIIAGAVVAAIVAVIIIVNVKKKKKRALEQKALEEMIDEEES